MKYNTQKRLINFTVYTVNTASEERKLHISTVERKREMYSSKALKHTAIH